MKALLLIAALVAAFLLGFVAMLYTLRRRFPLSYYLMVVSIKVEVKKNGGSTKNWICQ